LKYADLHIHTNFSDGSFSPREAVAFASELGLAAISITDHDTVEGIEPALEAGKEYGIEVIPGIELSADAERREIHILGYYIDWKDPQFVKRLKIFREARLKRAEKIVEKLEGLGVKIDFASLVQAYGKGSLGRLHIAQEIRKFGYAGSINEVFERYLGDYGPAYVPKQRLLPSEAIDLILKVGGVPVYAHPHISSRDGLIPQFAKEGLRGLEAYHSEQAPPVSKHYARLAQKYGLLITGGSDCHGHGKSEVLMGKVKIPYEFVERLKDVRKDIQTQRA
jgi:predicted metal-dependent phosphoesterase TrpH